jgi:hypothetical protein
VQSIVIAVVVVVLAMILAILAVFLVKRSRKRRDIAYRPDVYSEPIISHNLGMRELPPPPQQYQDANGYFYNEAGELVGPYQGYTPNEHYQEVYAGYEGQQQYVQSSYENENPHQVRLRVSCLFKS